MQLHELKMHIVNKEFDPLYVFTGEEVGIMDIYIKKIATAANLELHRADKMGDVFSKLKNKSFVNTDKCYVIRHDKDYTKHEELWDNMKEGNTQGKSIIILVYTNPDKRGKFYKQHKDMMCEFNYLPKEVVAKYIMKEVDLSVNQAQELAEICQCDYTRSLLECDKIKQYANAEGIPHGQSYKTLLDWNLFFIPPNDVVFQFVDAVCKRKVLQAYAALQELMEVESSPLGAIALLYNNFQQMLIVQNYKGDNITKATGLTGWQVGMAKQKLGKYNVSELVTILHTIKDVEKGIKTGWIEAELALNYILARVM